jgi:uncharacterized protein YpuA (DUF1002 family)
MDGSLVEEKIMGKVRIETNGKPFDIKITDAETGEELRNVKSLHFSADADLKNGLPRCEIVVAAPIVNASVEANITSTPLAYDPANDVVVFEGMAFSGELLREIERKRKAGI